MFTGGEMRLESNKQRAQDALGSKLNLGVWAACSLETLLLLMMLLNFSACKNHRGVCEQCSFPGLPTETQ